MSFRTSCSRVPKVGAGVHLGQDFLAGDAAALVLGDNIFHGVGLGTRLEELTGGRVARVRLSGLEPARGQGGRVRPDGTICRWSRSPSRPGSNYAVPGLYFYGRRRGRGRAGAPSARGELEITAVNEGTCGRGG